MISECCRRARSPPEPGGLIRLKCDNKRRTIWNQFRTIIGRVRTPVTLVSVENIRNRRQILSTNYANVSSCWASATSRRNSETRSSLERAPTMLFMPGNGRIAARAIWFLGSAGRLQSTGSQNERQPSGRFARQGQGRPHTIHSETQYALTLAGNMLSTQVTMTIKLPHALEVSTLEWAWSAQHHGGSAFQVHQRAIALASPCTNFPACLQFARSIGRARRLAERNE